MIASPTFISSLSSLSFLTKARSLSAPRLRSHTSLVSLTARPTHYNATSPSSPFSGIHSHPTVLSMNTPFANTEGDDATFSPFAAPYQPQSILAAENQYANGSGRASPFPPPSHALPSPATAGDLHELTDFDFGDWTHDAALGNADPGGWDG